MIKTFLQVFSAFLLVVVVLGAFFGVLFLITYLPVAWALILGGLWVIAGISAAIALSSEFL